MPSIVTTTPNTLVRISPKDSHQLQYSDLKGIVWHNLGCPHQFRFQELIDPGDREILAVTDQGLYYSDRKCQVWHLRRR